jgi:hypothetical protein
MYGGVEEAKKDIYKYFGGETTAMMESLTIIFSGRHWYEHC